MTLSAVLPTYRTAEHVSQRFERIGRHHPERRSLESFISSVFHAEHGANIRHFCDTLIGCRDREGNWTAALGFSLAKENGMFLEQYLDVPLEAAIAARVGTVVQRDHIVEVGNLAAINAGAARTLILAMTNYLYYQGMVWVAFTATRGLLNSFARMRLHPQALVDADPSRLPDQGASWGSYYAARPQVMFGDISLGYAQISK